MGYFVTEKLFHVENHDRKFYINSKTAPLKSGLLCCWLDAEDDQSAAVNIVKLLPSVGRGTNLPPICDISLPKAYHDELKSHSPMLFKSGLGRGQQLQELVGHGSDMEHSRKHLFPIGSVPELPIRSFATEDEFPELPSANRQDVILQDEPAGLADAEASKISLKSLAAQFTSIK